MKSIDWHQVNWWGILFHAIYVWLLGIALAFFASVFGFADSPELIPALTLLVALATIWASYRLASRTGQQPILHGLLVGLLVGLAGLLLNLFSSGLGVVEIAGFLLQVLGGLMGGRMVQRVLAGER